MVGMRDTAAYLGMLRETAHTFSGVQRDADVVQALLVQVVSALEARGALVRLLSPDGDELLPTGALGLSEEYLHKGPVLVAESQVDQRVLGGEVVIIPDITQEPGSQYPEAAADEGLRGMVAVPLSVRGRVIGVLRAYIDEASALGQEDILLLDTLADMGALVLEKIRLHQSLYHIAQALNASLELRPMLTRVLAAAVKEMGLKAASIRLLDPQRTLRLVAARGLSEAYLSKGKIHVDKSPVDQRALEGEVVVLYDVEGEAGFEYPEEATREGIRSVLVVPLKLKDRPLGVLRAYSAQSRHFGRVAIGFLSSIADLVALAIENAELYATLEARCENLKLDVADWYRFLALG
jgi:GAF domain-containing protein